VFARQTAIAASCIVLNRSACCSKSAAVLAFLSKITRLPSADTSAGASSFEEQASTDTSAAAGASSFEALASTDSSGPFPFGKLFLPAFSPLTLSLCKVEDVFIQY